MPLDILIKRAINVEHLEKIIDNIEFFKSNHPSLFASVNRRVRQLYGVDLNGIMIKNVIEKEPLYYYMI